MLIILRNIKDSLIKFLVPIPDVLADKPRDFQKNEILYSPVNMVVTVPLKKGLDNVHVDNLCKIVIS